MPSEKFWHEIFSSENVMMKNFSHKLFGVEINANENESNYFTS